MFYFHPVHKNVGNLSKIGVHTSNCCLKKWAEEQLDEKIGSCEPTFRFTAQQIFVINSYKPSCSELKLAWIARFYDPVTISWKPGIRIITIRDRRIKGRKVPKKGSPNMNVVEVPVRNPNYQYFARNPNYQNFNP